MDLRTLGATPSSAAPTTVLWFVWISGCPMLSLVASIRLMKLQRGLLTLPPAPSTAAVSDFVVCRHGSGHTQSVLQVRIEDNGEDDWDEDAWQAEVDAVWPALEAEAVRVPLRP